MPCAHGIACLGNEPSCDVGGDEPKTVRSPAAEADSTEGCRGTPRRPQSAGRRDAITPQKRSGGYRRPTALAEVDRGLSDGLKVVPNPWIGVEITLYLIPDLIPGLAFEAREEVVHVGVGG
jgi:hypothetical protein